MNPSLKELTDEIMTQVIIFGKCLPKENGQKFLQIACSNGESIFPCHIRDKVFLKKLLSDENQFFHKPFYCVIRMRQFLTKDGIKNIYDILQVNKEVDRNFLF